jgi:hypothetical protein
VAEEPKPVAFRVPTLAHLLAQLGSGWLTYYLGCRTNSSGTKMEMENAHIEIPMSNYLF